MTTNTQADNQQTGADQTGTQDTGTQQAGAQSRPAFYQEVLVMTSDDPRRLIFLARPGAPAPPEDLAALVRDFMRTARVVRRLFDADKATRIQLFDLMHRAADRAARGQDFSVTDGRANLEDVQEAIADAAFSVRDARLSKYHKLVVTLGILPILLGLAFSEVNWLGSLVCNTFIVKYLPIALFIVGAATISVWADFALRVHDDLTFGQLLVLDQNKWRPEQRVTTTIGIAFIFAFILSLNLVQVGMGGVLLNDFKDKPLLALVVGGITGFAFTAVRDILFKLKPDNRP